MGMWSSSGLLLYPVWNWVDKWAEVNLDQMGLKTVTYG